MTRTRKPQTPTDQPLIEVETVLPSLKYEQSLFHAASDPIPRVRFKDHNEATFIAEKRTAGYTDSQIAAMMGRSEDFVRKQEVVDHSDPEGPRVKEQLTVKIRRRIEPITLEERARRNHAAKGTTSWHAPPKP